MERKNAWTTYNETDLAALEAISKKYRAYLDNGKTERECVTETIKLAEANGYTDLNDAIKAGMSPNEAYEKNIGTYGRFKAEDGAVKWIDPRKE